MLKNLKYPLLIFTAAVAINTSPVLASGSDAVGQAQTGSGASYNQGKRVYATQLACEACPMAGQDLNTRSALNLLAKLPESQLKENDKEALSVYLKRRFKL